MSDTQLNPNIFKFEPYFPNRGGESGPLQLATSIEDPKEQYIVKCERHESACNEYVYHKVASALGLHTLEVKLFPSIMQDKGVDDYLTSTIGLFPVGIRYNPNIKPVTDHYLRVGSQTYNDWIAFQTLYVILSEEDSQEYFIDETGNLLKLDNSASFFINHNDIILTLYNTDESQKFLGRKLGYPAEKNFPMILRILTEQHGEHGKKACISLFRCFASIEDKAIVQAIEPLILVYPKLISDYFYTFLMRRRDQCIEFIQNIS